MSRWLRKLRELVYELQTYALISASNAQRPDAKCTEVRHVYFRPTYAALSQAAERLSNPALG